MMATNIDGQILEGGGQILRNSLALSCLLNKPIVVNNIRGKRTKPGLRPQHLTGVRLVCEICNGSLVGDKVGSSEITFHPSDVQSGDYSADVQTAGSICLLIQVALPCLAFGSARSTLLLKGGTDVEFAPPIEFFTEIFNPVAKKFGLKTECNIRRRGFYPKGNGEVTMEIHPFKVLSPINLTVFGKLTEIRGNAYVAGALPLKVARIMAQEATIALKKALPSVHIQIDAYQCSRDQAFGTGAGIFIVAETSTGCLLSSSALAKKGVPQEKIGASVAETLIQNIENEDCVDEHLQDQMILFMALASGKSAIRTGTITLHTQTAIHMAEMLTEAKFSIIKSERNGKESNLIECMGMGLKR